MTRGTAERRRRNAVRPLVALFAYLLASSGCGSEQGAPPAGVGGAPGATGGAPTATGGVGPSGGTVTTTSGGTVATGGVTPTGGTTGGTNPSTGGVATGGASGSGGTTGGMTGGSATGGASTGGQAAGGTPSGGTQQGGAGASATGGASGSDTGGGSGDCMTPPPAPEQIGWSTQGGGTTGGGDAAPMVVTSANELTQALMGNGAAVIHVSGNLSGSFSFGSNKTVIGVCGAEIHGHLHISGQSNVIVRNLKMVGYNCSDSPNNCSAGDDGITVRSSNHIWFDHMDISDGSDGNLDMTNNSDYITISFTKFYYSTMRTDPEQGESGHRFSNLIGASDSDSGGYRISFHHDWWAQNVDQRMPRTRFGDIHVFNNLYTSSGNLYCTNAGIQTHVLVQNNVYRNVNNPLSPDGNGDMRAEGNVFEGTTGNQSDNNGTGFTPPYPFDLDPTDGLADALMAEVGPH